MKTCFLLWVLSLSPLVIAVDEPGSAQLILGSAALAEQKAHQRAAKLDQCRAAGHDIAYPDAALAVTGLFCRFSPYDASQPSLPEAVVRSMAYIREMLAAELRKAEEVLAGRAAFTTRITASGMASSRATDQGIEQGYDGPGSTQGPSPCLVLRSSVARSPGPPLSLRHALPGIG